MKGLHVSAKGPLVLLSIALLLPECVLSAPKVGRNNDNIGHEENSIHDSFSEKYELDIADEVWYPVKEVSNDYYDQKDDDSDDKELEENAKTFRESEHPKTPEGISVASVTLSPHDESNKNYTTFCEEMSGGSCPPEEDYDEDEDDEVKDRISSINTEKLVLKNETSQVKPPSSNDSLEISSVEYQEGGPAKSELVNDLETELDCLIEDVEMILDHTKQFIKDSSQSSDESHSQLKEGADKGPKKSNKTSHKPKDSKLINAAGTDKVKSISKSHVADYDNDIIEDEDLIESVETDIQVKVHSDTKIHPEHNKSSEDSDIISDQDLQDTLNPKKLEDIIKKEQQYTKSHNGSHKDHHVKEHVINDYK